MDETPHDGPRLNRSISGLYEACRASVDKYRKSRINREATLFKTLGSALELFRLSEKSSENEAELKKLMKDKGIRITKRTQNHFTPIVKLIFEGEVIEKEKSLVMRCASVLRLADSMEIEPDDIGKFVDEQGGIVQCYKLDREMHPAVIANSSKSDPIDALLQNAEKCDATTLRHLVPEGPAAALLEVDHDGNILLLGAWGATEVDIRRYKKSTNSTTTDKAAMVNPGIAPPAIEHAEHAAPS
jgi:hypothetical protein